eukprot:TRINITY_DN9189_c0_g1_i2.p1 TRINITY_DN9189_c0_g1~~TRINITY_DN9189_c0_g1_i2.p1  ORF type:complete len:195 (+),score=14.19 TRINITY_DN9189_c0_g1_i2:45-587(+)
MSDRVHTPAPWIKSSPSTRSGPLSRLASGCSGRSGRSVAASAAGSSAASRAPSIGGLSRRSASCSASGHSGIGELPRRPPVTPWQVPTRALLGHEMSNVTSDRTSVRTATTIREFFDEENRWANGPSRGGQVAISKAAEAASVLPGVPRGHVPGVRRGHDSGRSERMFAAPHPATGAPRY